MTAKCTGACNRGHGRRADTALHSDNRSAAAIDVRQLSVNGWVEARLSHRFGVRVADEETQAAGFRQGRKGDTGGRAYESARPTRLEHATKAE